MTNSRSPFPLPAAAATPPAEPVALPPKPRILVVDDSSLARRTLRHSLEQMDCTVEEAVDGGQALERYFLGRHDLVILDLVMEGMTGLDTLAKMRALDPKVRVIISTADIQQSTRDEAQAAGAAGLINKPVTSRSLVELVTRILEGSTKWN